MTCRIIYCGMVTAFFFQISKTKCKICCTRISILTNSQPSIAYTVNGYSTCYIISTMHSLVTWIDIFRSLYTVAIVIFVCMSMIYMYSSIPPQYFSQSCLFDRVKSVLIVNVKYTKSNRYSLFPFSN